MPYVEKPGYLSTNLAKKKKPRLGGVLQIFAALRKHLLAMAES